MRGESSGAGSLPDPYLRLLDSSGDEIAANDDAGSLDSRILYEADTTGTYFIAARELGSGIGTYELSVSDPQGALLV